MSFINALVLDTQPILRNAIISLIQNSQLKIDVFQSNSIVSAREIVMKNNIKIILLDVELSDGSGLDFIRRLRGDGFRGKVLFISSNNHPMYSRVAKDIGANGYILKSKEAQSINEAIFEICRGYSVFQKTLDSMWKLPELSERESIVYSYLSQGYSNKKTSELLSLSSKTVSTYKTRILEKFNASSIIEVMELLKSSRE